MVNLQMTEKELQELLRVTKLLAAFNSLTFTPSEPEITSTTQALAGGLRNLPIANDLRGLSPEAADAVRRQWVEETQRSGGEYCKQKNAGKSGRSSDNSPAQKEIDEQVSDYLAWRKARGFVKRSS